MSLSRNRRASSRENYTVGFYNLENLFDTTDHPELLDDDFTPKGFKRWTPKRYENKLFKLGRTISQMAVNDRPGVPVLLGLAEVENSGVLDDLLQTKPLAQSGISYVHYDSPDERGIDTALLYHKEHFEPLEQQNIPVLVYEPDGRRDYTRDVVYVRGLLNGEEVHVFVNHWPSRRDGDASTVHKRITAAETVRSFIASLNGQVQQPNYIVMGDFNAGPGSEPLRRLQEETSLHNPMDKLLTPHTGSANYKRKWTLFDQILISHTFFKVQPGSHSFQEAQIFDEAFLQEWSEPFKGKPFRTYAGPKYLGGYSDHFPVCLRLKYHP